MSIKFYQHLSMSIKFYQYLSNSINICQCLSNSINIYQILSTSVNVYQILSISIKFYQYLSAICSYINISSLSTVKYNKHQPNSTGMGPWYSMATTAWRWLGLAFFSSPRSVWIKCRTWYGSASPGCSPWASVFFAPGSSGSTHISHRNLWFHH